MFPQTLIHQVLGRGIYTQSIGSSTALTLTYKSFKINYKKKINKNERKFVNAFENLTVSSKYSEWECYNLTEELRLCLQPLLVV